MPTRKIIGLSWLQTPASSESGQNSSVRHPTGRHINKQQKKWFALPREASMHWKKTQTPHPTLHPNINDKVLLVQATLQWQIIGVKQSGSLRTGDIPFGCGSGSSLGDPNSVLTQPSEQSDSLDSLVWVAAVIAAPRARCSHTQPRCKHRYPQVQCVSGSVFPGERGVGGRGREQRRVPQYTELKEINK